MTILPVVIIALAWGLYWLVNFRPAKIAWASLRYGNTEHFLACENLPFFVQVEKAMDDHADVVEKLKNTAGVKSVSAKEIRCSIVPGGIEFIKGEMLLEYENRTAQSGIRKLIGDNFFGISYRGVNK